MTGTTAGKLRALAVVVAMSAWAVAAHYGSAGEGHAEFNVLLGLIPIALLVFLLLWQLRYAPAMAAGLLLFAGLAYLAWPLLRDNVRLLYYVQHLGAHLALAAFFGRTLIGPGDALITRLARSIYGDALSPRKVRYTRGATAAWTLFFLGNALASTLLFLFASVRVWSLHANLLTWPLVGLMFLAEHLWRKVALPPEERPGVADIVAAYRRYTREQAPPSRS